MFTRASTLPASQQSFLTILNPQENHYKNILLGVGTANTFKILRYNQAQQTQVAHSYTEINLTPSQPAENNYNKIKYIYYFI